MLHAALAGLLLQREKAGGCTIILGEGIVQEPARGCAAAPFKPQMCCWYTRPPRALQLSSRRLLEEDGTGGDRSHQSVSDQGHFTHHAALTAELPLSPSGGAPCPRPLAPERLPQGAGGGRRASTFTASRRCRGW
jgi:hypothetical protein